MLFEFSSFLKRGPYIGGERISNIELNFANEICSGYPVAVANGLEALEIALQTLGIGKGMKVAVPAHTFIASWLAIIRVGAIPIGIDVDMRGQINISDLELLDEKIDAVMPVHMHGMACDMELLMRLALKRQWIIIEDASQAHGLLCKGKRVGEFGDAAAFSLYPTKNIGGLGDGGMIVFKKLENANVAKLIRSYGANPENKYEHIMIGMNSRLDPIQTIPISLALKNYKKNLLRRRRIATHYIRAIKNNPSFGLMESDPNKSIWHHFPILAKNRDTVRDNLLQMGFMTEIHYPNVAANEILKLSHRNSLNFPNAELLAKSILSLPIYSGLKDRKLKFLLKFLRNWKS